MSLNDDQIFKQLKREIEQLSLRQSLLQGIAIGCINTTNVRIPELSSEEMQCIKEHIKDYTRIRRGVRYERDLKK